MLCLDGFCLFGRLAHLNAGVWHKSHEKILYCQCKSDRTEYVNLSNRRYGIGVFYDAFQICQFEHNDRGHQDIGKHAHGNHALFWVSQKRCDKKQNFRHKKHNKAYRCDVVVNFPQSLVFFGEFAFDFDPRYGHAGSENGCAYQTQSQKQILQLLRILPRVKTHFHRKDESCNEKESVKEDKSHMFFPVSDIREGFENRFLTVQTATYCRNRREDNAPKGNQNHFERFLMFIEILGFRRAIVKSFHIQSPVKFILNAFITQKAEKLNSCFIF